MVLASIALGRPEEMREFSDMGKFAAHLAKQAVIGVVALEAASEAIGRHVEKVAKAEFGHYQDEVGPFPAWPELADSTKEDRLKQGYTENDPLLRSGELRDTISHKSSALEVVIGSTDDVMIYHEFGTSKMPARPVLGPAAHNSKHVIEELVGAAIVTAVVGGNPVHPALGYDFETKP